MPYVDLAGLSRYASRQKDRLERDYALLRDMQWLRTEKAGAVSLWPVGGTPLKPSVDFMFTETPPASGDKSPANPSTVSGVSSVLLSQIGGKNLLAYNFSSVAVPSGTTKTYSSGITATNNNGVYSLSGTATSDTNIYITHTTEEQNKLKIPAGTYTLSGFTAPDAAPSGTEIRLQLYNAGNPTPQTVTCRNGSASFTIDTVKICNVYIRTKSGTIYPTGFTCSPQLELGDTATAFEPSTVSEYPLPLGDTYYGGTLDVASGVMTVTWEGMVLTGEETITEESQSTSTGAYQYGIKPGLRYAEQGYDVCTHFLRGAGTAGAGHFYVRYTGGTGVRFFTDISTVQGFADFLAAQYANGTPVVFAYKLATPYTVQLDPVSISALAQADKYTPRLNTVYTDASAVQVGYVKSPIREEYELQQAVIAQGGNV